MINEETINKYKIFSLSKSQIAEDGSCLYLGKSMDEYFLVIKIERNGYEHEPTLFNSYSKARSSIGNPIRMVPVFKIKNFMEIKCECCGQVIKKR